MPERGSIHAPQGSQCVEDSPDHPQVSQWRRLRCSPETKESARCHPLRLTRRVRFPHWGQEPPTADTSRLCPDDQTRRSQSARPRRSVANPSAKRASEIWRGASVPTAMIPDLSLPRTRESPSVDNSRPTRRRKAEVNARPRRITPRESAGGPTRHAPWIAFPGGPRPARGDTLKRAAHP